MRFLRQGLNGLLLIGMILGVQGQGQKCSPYPNDGLCVNYISNKDYVYAKGRSILGLENSFSSLASAQGLSTLREGDSFLEECVQAFTSFICATEFPKCINYSSTASNTQVEVVPPCLSTCSNAIRHCRTHLDSASPDTQKIITVYILSSEFFPKDCAGNITTSPPLNFIYPTANCDESPQLSSRPKCFQPLIVDQNRAESNKNEINQQHFCKNGCCLPCPQAYGLYPSNQLENGFLATQIFRALSAIGSGIMVVVYMVLPGKRTHPSTLILFTSMSIFMYSSNVFFSILRPTIVQCANDIVPSTQENNPFFCGFQGALLIFASHATAIWIGFIILNLHIHTVWNSNIMKDKYIYLNIIGWGIPTILTITALGKKSISYQFATLCFVRVELSEEIFFYPLALIIVPSFFIHMSTFVYIYRISKKDEPPKDSEFMTHHLHVLQVIKIQWRALLLAIILLTTIIFYWLFYFVELRKIANGALNNKFIVDWTLCIQSGKGQDYCAKNISSEHMPSFSLLFAAEMTVSLIGIHLIVIFFNKALWQECKQWINTKYRPKDVEFLAI